MARIELSAGPVQIGDVLVATSERNTTPLFGSGLIDAIPDAVIEAAAERASRLEDIPRDPWPRQPSCGRKNRSLRLEGSDGEPRGFRLDRMCRRTGAGGARSSPSAGPASGDKQAPGLDLSAQECEALTSFVATLPRPIERVPSTKGEIARIAAGRRLFKSIGCAACHRPQLGDVAGLYSDLLLHDMGPSLGGAGSYYNIPADSADTGSPASGVNRPVARGAQRRCRQPGMAHPAALGNS